MKTSRKALALMLSLTMLLSAFSGALTANAVTKKPIKQELTFSLGEEPKNLDPSYYGGALTWGSEGGHILNNTFEGLLREVNHRFIPGIAEKYTLSDDGYTYTFFLRDAKWSDGVSVKAGDFEYAWKRAMSPDTASDYSYLFYCIKGAIDYADGKTSADSVAVKALDDKTLRVTLSSPDSTFPAHLSLHCFMPLRKDIVEQNPSGWSMDPKLAVSDGPFVISSFTSGKGCTLIKNKNYWNAKSVKLTKISALFSDDETQAVLNYKKGALDMVDIMDASLIPALQNKESTFQLLPEHMTYYFTFNTQLKPFQDSRVRRALSLAINREELVKTAAKAGVLPAGGIVPPGYKDAEGKDFRTKAGNYGLLNNPTAIEDAKKLLADAGYPNGAGFPDITIKTTASQAEHTAISNKLASMWKENLGITATVVTVTSKELQAALSSGDFMVCRQGWGADFGDPMTFISTFLGVQNDGNGTLWKSDAYDQLLYDAWGTDGAAKDNSMYAAEKMLIEEGIILPIYYLTDPILVQKKVANWEKDSMAYWWFGSTYIRK